MVANETDAVVIERKSNLKPCDIDEHLERLAKVKRLLPKYAGCRIVGAMVIEDNVATYAPRQGFIVIGQSGDHLEIRNDANFKPRVS